MSDYTWPSVYFAYFFFALCFALAVYFFMRSRKDGYWDKASEDIKYQVFDEQGGADGFAGRETAARQPSSPPKSRSSR